MPDTGRLQREAILRIGEVVGVTGRKVSLRVDEEKNLSDLFLDGETLKNIAVGSYVDIRKGFMSLIGKVEGEVSSQTVENESEIENRFPHSRVLSVSLVGYIDRQGWFNGGTKELPLVGNEGFILSRSQLTKIHSLVKTHEDGLDIAVSDYEGFNISLPIDGLINSHIAIFGNTGSGKSNTLAHLYKNFVEKMRARDAEAFERNCRVLVFDFNGEYGGEECITREKQVYRLSTRLPEGGDRVPLSADSFYNVELLGILADATEKTQKPFLKRAINKLDRVRRAGNPNSYAQAIIGNLVKDILQMSDKIRADLLIGYLDQILPEKLDELGNPISLRKGIEWHNGSHGFFVKGTGPRNYVFYDQAPDRIAETHIFRQANEFELSDEVITNLISFCYVQLIEDVLANRAVNEHIAPVINKLKSKQKDIEKVFRPSNDEDIFTRNIVIVSLNEVNLEMRKTVPLLLCKKVYQDKKEQADDKSLSIVIDEAHNILSRESFREAESWKDYRLETFEEIVKEGRKFGVFVTISSQRPHDISPTITSQAHNYFIHRLINDKDLQSIASAVSYIDRITEESIPTLPTGTCIFSGVASQMPLKISIKELPEEHQPKSQTLTFRSLVP